jgi:two-component system cell cycle response regulator CtrA
LVANLDAIIRRTHGHSSATVNVGNLMVDLSRNYAKIGDARLDLTAKEFRIIEFLGPAQRCGFKQRCVFKPSLRWH